MKRIAINGFGRIGSAFLRLVMERKDIEVIAINDLADVESGKYSFQYDTAHGKYNGSVKTNSDELQVDGKKILWISERDPSKLPWGKLNIDVVVEATGIFTDFKKAHMHIDAGAKKVLITGPVKGEVPQGIKADTVVIGVNTQKAKVCDITSNASCTTNSVGIPLKVLDSVIGIEKAMLNTIHAYTASQKIVDGISKKNLRLGRAGAQNIVPTSTGAAAATAKVLPQLKNKFDGIAMRVPIISGSIADITFISKRNTSVEEVNEIITSAANKPEYSKLLGVTKEEIVSSDIIGCKYAALIDLSLTRVVDGNLVKILSWYDNEFGYANSLIEHINEL